MASISLPATLDAVAESMCAKALLPRGRAWVLAMLAGIFIALAGFGSTMISCNLLVARETYGVGRCLAGIIFPIGLIMVVVGGAELFTGNCLMFESMRRGLISPGKLLRSWAFVYAGNLAGSILVSLMLYFGDAFHLGNGALAAAVIKTAASKAQMTASGAFFLGILCNLLVCMSIWQATRTDEVAHKAFLAFFPIWLFVASGFEHSVANMYYLSAGFFATLDGQAVALAALPQAALAQVNIPALAHNLFFVSLGNIVGGTVFVSGAYAIAFGKRDNG